MFIKTALFTFILLIAAQSRAQIADGSTAPDFTFKDINGITHNLYTYLDQGKYVAIDFSATWCGPCWDYHESGWLDALYEKHDNPGDQNWKVFFIEGDDNTNSADLRGTGSNTMGDWVTGSNYIIIDAPGGSALNNFMNNYGISFYPTFFLICPDRKVYQESLQTAWIASVQVWENVANNSCAPLGLDRLKDPNPLTIYPNPATDQTSLYFGVNSPSAVKLEVTDILGQCKDTKDFGIILPGNQSIKYDLSNLNPGIYFFTISSGNNRFIRKKVVVQ